MALQESLNMDLYGKSSMGKASLAWMLTNFEKKTSKKL
jgi:hypothetical protein